MTGIDTLGTNEAALEVAIKKMRKLRLIDHVAIKGSCPSVTFLGVMKDGMGGCYDDAALDYVFRRFLKYYGEALSAEAA